MRMYGSKQPFGTLPTHNAAMQGGSTPKSSQYFPILPKTPTTAAIYPIAREPRRSVTKPGVCGKQQKKRRRSKPTPLCLFHCPRKQAYFTKVINFAMLGSSSIAWPV